MPEQFQPWTWKVPEASESIRRSMTRQDAHDRVTGQAIYTRDICLPGMLYAKILTSPYAHAKIMSIDTSEAEALPGVRDILKYDDPDVAKDRVIGTDNSANFSILSLPGISDFYQHPMGVAVVADSEEICDRALRLMKIEWEERPFILDMEESLKPNAPKIMSEVERLNPRAKGPNTVLTERVEIGNTEKGFAIADTIMEYKIKRALNSPAGVEAMACVAQWRGDFLDLWVHHQSNPQSNLSSRGMGMFGIGRQSSTVPFTHWSKITVTFPYQGSWFGGLTWLAYSNSFIRLAVILAKRLNGKPVKLLYDESNFYCGGDEAGMYTCKVGAKKDGTITAYNWHVVGVRNPAVDKTYECTCIPNILGTQEWAFTNRSHQACFRHGAASCVPHNIMFDRVSAELGLDPTKVALINDGCQGHDWNWITQYQKENGFPQRQSLKEVIELGKKAIDWDRKWHAPGEKKLLNGRMHGLGFTSVNEWHWGAGIMTLAFPSFACLMLRDGKITIVGLRCDMGIDSESGYRGCVAAELGMKYEDTLIQEQRSDNSAYNLSQPAGSSGTVNATLQLVVAAREMKQKILEYAAMPRPGFMGGGTQRAFFPDKKPDDLDIKDSMIFEKANPDNRRTVGEVAEAFWRTNPAIVHPVFSNALRLTSDGKPSRQSYVMGRQAHFIEVEVDTEIGQVEVEKVVCVNDVGHLFNPEGAMGQQYGGAVMGFGRSATEEKIYCPATGVGLNCDHINYFIGTMNDYPPVQCIFNESHLGYASYGSYGIGENVGASLSAITCSAIYNAIGKWIFDFPITPDKVLKALGKV
jgi:CO/xanthine dehydrogenase Mo-binding subunit